jgi:hypothetical protein
MLLGLFLRAVSRRAEELRGWQSFVASSSIDLAAKPLVMALTHVPMLDVSLQLQQIRQLLTPDAAHARRVQAMEHSLNVPLEAELSDLRFEILEE